MMVHLGTYRQPVRSKTGSGSVEILFRRTRYVASLSRALLRRFVHYFLFWLLGGGGV